MALGSPPPSSIHSWLLVLPLPVFLNLHLTMMDDDDDWNAICLDPFAASKQKGQSEGHLAGLEEGLQQGKMLGRTKGLEYGMELGYMQGILDALRTNNNGFVGDINAIKVQRSMNELQRLLEEFPSPDELFAREKRILPLPENGPNTQEIDSELAASSIDIHGQLQRIHARYKLLCTQLGLGKLQLKHVLNVEGKDREVMEHEW